MPQIHCLGKKHKIPKRPNTTKILNAINNSSNVHQLYNITFCNFPLQWNSSTQKWIYRQQHKLETNYYVVFGTYKLLLILCAGLQIMWIKYQHLPLTKFYLSVVALEVSGLLAAIFIDLIYFLHGVNLVTAINWAYDKQETWLSVYRIGKCR